MFLDMWIQGKVNAVGLILTLRTKPVSVSPIGPNNYLNDVMSHPIQVSQITGQAQLLLKAVGAREK